MSVHYKFKNAIDYDTVTFDGVQITVADLKKAIMYQKKVGKGDCDYLISDAQTNQPYEDENDLIPKNSSVIVARIPLAERARRHYNNKEAEPNSTNQNDSSGHHVAIEKITKSSDMTKYDTEEERISATISQSTEAYEPSKFVRGHGRGGYSGGPLPSSYKCYKCQQPGHHIKDCPANIQDNKRSTGIPRSFMVPCDASDKGAYRTPDGGYARPIVEAEAYQVVKKEKPPTFASVYEPTSVDGGGGGSSVDQMGSVLGPIPTNLACSLCQGLLRDAVLVSCCAGQCCDLCIRSALIESDEHECPLCAEKGVSPDSLIPCLKLRKEVTIFSQESNPLWQKVMKNDQEVPSLGSSQEVLQEEQVKEEIDSQDIKKSPTEVLQEEEIKDERQEDEGPSPEFEGLPPPAPIPNTIQAITTRSTLGYPQSYAPRHIPPPGLPNYPPRFPPRHMSYYGRPPGHEAYSGHPRRPLLGEYPPGYAPPIPSSSPAYPYPTFEYPSGDYPPDYRPYYDDHRRNDYGLNYDEAVERFTRNLLRRRTRSRSRDRSDRYRRRTRSPPDSRRRIRSRSPHSSYRDEPRRPAISSRHTRRSRSRSTGRSGRRDMMEEKSDRITEGESRRYRSRSTDRSGRRDMMEENSDRKDRPRDEKSDRKDRPREEKSDRMTDRESHRTRSRSTERSAHRDMMEEKSDRKDNPREEKSDRMTDRESRRSRSRSTDRSGQRDVKEEESDHKDNPREEKSERKDKPKEEKPDRKIGRESDGKDKQREDGNDRKADHKSDRKREEKVERKSEHKNDHKSDRTDKVREEATQRKTDHKKDRKNKERDEKSDRKSDHEGDRKEKSRKRKSDHKSNHDSDRKDLDKKQKVDDKTESKSDRKSRKSNHKSDHDSDRKDVDKKPKVDDKTESKSDRLVAKPSLSSLVTVKSPDKKDKRKSSPDRNRKSRKRKATLKVEVSNLTTTDRQPNKRPLKEKSL